MSDMASCSVYSSFIGRTGALIWATFKRDIPRVIGLRKCYESMPLAARAGPFKILLAMLQHSLDSLARERVDQS